MSEPPLLLHALSYHLFTLIASSQLAQCEEKNIKETKFEINFITMTLAWKSQKKEGENR